MSVVEFKPRKRKLNDKEKAEKKRAKKIYDNMVKIRKSGGEIETDEHTTEFLAKYGYEL